MEYDRLDIMDPEIVETATIGGTGYECVPRAAQNDPKLAVDEVILQQTTLSARFWAADFSTVPADGQKVTLRGNTHRILSKQLYASDGKTFVLLLGDEFARR